MLKLEHVNLIVCGSWVYVLIFWIKLENIKNIAS